jgi:tetratricopeptide (TPR) repeat protein
MMTKRIACIASPLMIVGLFLNGCGPSLEDQTATAVAQTAAAATNTPTVTPTSTPTPTPNAETYFNRGMVHYEQGDLVQAIADFDQAIALDPQFAGYYLRGRTHNELGNYVLAIADFDQAIALDPQSAIAYFWRGLAHVMNLDPERAIADLERALTIGGLPPDYEQFAEESLLNLRDW